MKNKKMSDYNPMQHFQKWFYEADSIFDGRESNAMSLSTVGEDGYPKSRMVLLKQYTWEGFVFYTNYESDKAKAIAFNPSVCLLFKWVKSGRTVQIQGSASKISESESSNYFHSRPRGSQLGAWASQQSRVVEFRTVLDDRLKDFERQYEGKEIPKPVHWGGYIVKPLNFLFIENTNASFQMEENYHLQKDYNWSKNINIKLKTI